MPDTVEIDVPVQFSFFGTARRSRSADWRTGRTTVKARIPLLASGDREGTTGPDETAIMTSGTGSWKPLPVFGGSAYLPIVRRVVDQHHGGGVQVDRAAYAGILEDFRKSPALRLEADPFGFPAATARENNMGAEWKRKLVKDENDVVEILEGDLDEKRALAVRAAEHMAFVDGILHTSRYEIAAVSDDPNGGQPWTGRKVDVLDPSTTLRSTHGPRSHVRFDKVPSLLSGTTVAGGPSDPSRRRFRFRDFDHDVASSLHHFLALIHPTGGNGAVVEAWSPNWPGLTEEMEAAVGLCRNVLRRTIAAFPDPERTKALREEALDTLAACASAAEAMPVWKLVDGSSVARDGLVADLRRPGLRWDRFEKDWEDAPESSRLSDPADDEAVAVFSM